MISLPEQREHAFANPFRVEDLEIFDVYHLGRVLALARFTPEQLALAFWGAPARLVERVTAVLSMEERAAFCRGLAHPGTAHERQRARHLLLDALFWELTYWKTPELYEELVEGEQLHPGIFERLRPWLQHKIVLDVGAGCGRASFAALEHGAELVYALEPSPGLRRLFAQKLARSLAADSIQLSDGDFTHIPLPDRSIDVALACSAFTAEPAQGGEPGLAELRRVTRAGGFIVLIWPRQEDRAWLAEHGFHIVVLPQKEEMMVSFSSWQSAWRCVRRFYAHNPQVARYLLQASRPALPFAILGYNAPRDYCWLQVDQA